MLESAALFRRLHFALQSKRSSQPVVKDAVPPASFQFLQQNCTPKDAPILVDMLAILEQERTTNELAEELFDEFLDELAACESQVKKGDGRHIGQIIAALNQAVTISLYFEQSSDARYMAQLREVREIYREALKGPTTSVPPGVAAMHEDPKPATERQNANGIITARQLVCHCGYFVAREQQEHRWQLQATNSNPLDEAWTISPQKPRRQAIHYKRNQHRVLFLFEF